MDEDFGSSYITVSQSNVSVVYSHFRSVALLRGSLSQIALCTFYVTFLEGNLSQVVVCAVVVRILLGSGLVDIFFSSHVVGQGSVVKHFLNVELRRIFLVLSLDFVVAATDEVVVDGHA